MSYNKNSTIFGLISLFESVINLQSQDVVVDIVGYRKHGHNEIDEPMFTQPIMYTVVRKHKDVMQLYSKKLQDEGKNCFKNYQLGHLYLKLFLAQYI